MPDHLKFTDASRYSPGASVGDASFDDVDTSELPRIARPPRSQQRSPNSVDSLPLHTRVSSASSSKLPVSPSWSGSGGLTRSYNMRDLSLTETLEAPVSSDSKSPASPPPLWSNNAASSLRKELQAGENGDRLSREKKLPSPSLEADNFQSHDAVPNSLSYIPPFDFDSSPVETSYLSEYAAKSMPPEDFPPRTYGSTPLQLPTPPPRHQSRPNSPASHLSHAPAAKYVKDTADSGSEYSPDEMADREPARRGSHPQKSKSPPRSPAPTMMKTSKSLAALDSLVAQEQAEFGSDEEAAREARRRGERESSSHSDESRTVEANPPTRRTSTEARIARTRRISERALARKVEQEEEEAEERELRTERQVSEGGTWWKSGGLVVGGRELKDREATPEDSGHSGSKDRNTNVNHVPTQVIVTSPSDRSLGKGVYPTCELLFLLLSDSAQLLTHDFVAMVRAPSFDDYKVSRVRSTSPPGSSARLSQSSSPADAVDILNPPATPKTSSPLPSPPLVSPTAPYSSSPVLPTTLHRTTSPPAPLREPVSAAMLNTPESFSNSRNIFSRHALNLDTEQDDDHSVPPLPSPRDALRFGNNTSGPLRSPTAFEFSAFPSAPLEALSVQPEIAISSEGSPRVDSSPELSFSSPGGSPSRQKNLPILRAKSSRRTSTNATRRAAAAGNPMPTLDSLDDIGAGNENTDEDATPRKTASRRGEGLLRAR